MTKIEKLKKNWNFWKLCKKCEKRPKCMYLQTDKKQYSKKHAKNRGHPTIDWTITIRFCAGDILKSTFQETTEIS